MRAIILAAGIGKRLSMDKPKVLLELGGRTLLERHLAILRAIGIEDVTLGVGFAADAVAAELERVARPDVRTVHNPDYTEGSVVTLWTLQRALRAGGDVLLMDGDVLYDRRMLERLTGSQHANCFLLDREVEPGEEPMKLAVKDGRLVDFRKTLQRAHDFYGESVGFFRFGEDTAERVADAARRIVSSGRREEYMEEAIRDVLLDSPSDAFGFEDVTGLPWIEIDFPEDVKRAESEILPALLAEDH